jgi:hypothetical protein
MFYTKTPRRGACRRADSENPGERRAGLLSIASRDKERVAENDGQSAAAATDCDIDRLVYDLYGLSEDEIRIVEETATNQA